LLVEFRHLTNFPDELRRTPTLVKEIEAELATPQNLGTHEQRSDFYASGLPNTDDFAALIWPTFEDPSRTHRQYLMFH